MEQNSGSGKPSRRRILGAGLMLCAGARAQTHPGGQAPADAASAAAPAPAAGSAGPTASAAGQRVQAGTVEFLDGSALVGTPGTPPRAMALQQPIYQGDRIATGREGEAHIRMADGGFIAVRPASVVVIRNYKAEGDAATDSSVLALVVGSMRSITGWIAGNNPARYRIQTPTATIGVRGTDHEPYVIPAGSALGEPGTYDKVNAGASYVEGRDASGQTRRVNVTPGQAGFFGRDGRAPRILDSVPALFRPGRNEARMEGLHERIRAQLGTLREQRRTQVLEQRRQRQGGGAAGNAATGRRADIQQQQQQRAQTAAERRQQRREQAGQTGQGRQGLAQQRAGGAAREARPAREGGVRRGER